MPFGMGIPKTAAPRREVRIPMEVGVRIAGHPALPGTETTFTENVSIRGARILSARRWQAEDRLTLATLTGSFSCVARVAYCESSRNAGFAVGVEFIEPNGNWVVAEPGAN